VFAGAFLAFEKVHAPASEEAANNTHSMTLTLTSPQFENGGKIPPLYTCDSDNINPEFRISGVPEGAKSLVLLADDPDIPDAVKGSMGIDAFDHWVLYGIPPETTVIPEGSTAGSEGLSSRGEPGYVGPCPPPEYEPKEHRYFFRLYALSGTLNFIKAPTLEEVKQAMEGMVIEETELMGRYERQ